MIKKKARLKVRIHGKYRNPILVADEENGQTFICEDIPNKRNVFLFIAKSKRLKR